MPAEKTPSPIPFTPFAGGAMLPKGGHSRGRSQPAARVILDPVYGTQDRYEICFSHEHNRREFVVLGLNRLDAAQAPANPPAPAQILTIPQVNPEPAPPLRKLPADDIIIAPDEDEPD